MNFEIKILQVPCTMVNCTLRTKTSLKYTIRQPTHGQPGQHLGSGQCPFRLPCVPGIVAFVFKNFFLFSCFVQTTQEVTIHQKFKAQAVYLHLPARVISMCFCLLSSSLCKVHYLWHTQQFRQFFLQMLHMFTKSAKS